MIQILTIPEIGPSANKFYAGMHYSKRKKIADGWHLLVSVEARNQKLVPVKVYPVTIDCRITFGKGTQSFDWDNCQPTVKLIQDGLCHAGILEGDGLKHIRGGRIWAVRGEKSMTQFAIREGSDAFTFG